MIIKFAQMGASSKPARSSELLSSYFDLGTIFGFAILTWALNYVIKSENYKFRTISPVIVIQQIHTPATTENNEPSPSTPASSEHRFMELPVTSPTGESPVIRNFKTIMIKNAAIANAI
jgi:hypothetical protein